MSFIDTDPLMVNIALKVDTFISLSFHIFWCSNLYEVHAAGRKVAREANVMFYYSQITEEEVSTSTNCRRSI